MVVLVEKQFRWNRDSKKLANAIKDSSVAIPADFFPAIVVSRKLENFPPKMYLFAFRSRFLVDDDGDDDDDDDDDDDEGE